MSLDERVSHNNRQSGSDWFIRDTNTYKHMVTTTTFVNHNTQKRQQNTPSYLLTLSLPSIFYTTTHEACALGAHQQPEIKKKLDQSFLPTCIPKM